VVDCLADDTLMQTKPGAAEVRILIKKNYINLVFFGGKKLIREFSDKGCNVQMFK